MTHLTADYDLKSIIHEFETNLWVTHKIKVEYTHIKGNQKPESHLSTTTTKTDPLNIPAQLNNLYDPLETTERHKMTQPLTLDTTIPQIRTTLLIKNIQITENIKNCIRSHLYDIKLKE